LWRCAKAERFGPLTQKVKREPVILSGASYKLPAANHNHNHTATMTTEQTTETLLNHLHQILVLLERDGRPDEATELACYVDNALAKGQNPKALLSYIETWAARPHEWCLREAQVRLAQANACEYVGDAMKLAAEARRLLDRADALQYEGQLVLASNAWQYTTV
jgi:hypothetical protein